MSQFPAAAEKPARSLDDWGCFLQSGASFYCCCVIERKASPNALLEYAFLRGKTIVTF